MGGSADLYSYDKKKLVEEIKSIAGIGTEEQIELLNKILDECGSTIGDRYILLSNDFIEEYDCSLVLSSTVSSAFGCDSDKVFDLIIEFGDDLKGVVDKKELPSSADAYEIADKLGFEITL